MAFVLIFSFMTSVEQIPWVVILIAWVPFFDCIIPIFLSSSPFISTISIVAGVSSVGSPFDDFSGKIRL